MPVMICWLRGVNVGGHHRLPMDVLRSLCEGLGLRGVRTLLQSGNAVFRVETKAVSRLAQRMEESIERHCGFRPAVVLRSYEELGEVVARNPLAAMPGIDPSRFAVAFLAGDPAAEAPERLRRLQRPSEQVWLHGRELYLYAPEGFAETKLAGAALDRALGTVATARNWNTIVKVLAVAGEVAAGTGAAQRSDHPGKG
jgi:uncharacterized protein (DUF1697 family)